MHRKAVREAAVNDETLAVSGVMTNYEILREKCKVEGLSNAEINSRIKQGHPSNELAAPA